ncbi:unnamed protein product, partial [Ectocarpus sp. 4 AP-2014]
TCNAKPTQSAKEEERIKSSCSSRPRFLGKTRRTTVAMTKHSSRLLGVLGAAVILSSVAAYSYSSDGCWEYGIGDGYCEQQNNNAECGYDGGDCCECTCQNPWGDDDDWICSPSGSGFACIDPAASCVDDDDITADMVENCDTSDLGDGYCDQDNNNEICGYDGGDCCECTCVNPWGDDDDWRCSSGGSGFACIDPAASCVDDDDITADMVENCEYVRGRGDGWCDEENNNELCGYDGGDCCECTCVAPPADDDWDDDWYGACGDGFACIDPSAACVDDDEVTVGMVESCDTVSIGDGYCDMDNNNEACAYDGGDCCECTCEDTPNNKCGRRINFACIDPAAPCVDDDSFTVDMIDNCKYPRGIGNGWCDVENNNELCAYDGGDCCSCTCQNDFDDDWACTTFACIDPEAACVNDDDITVDMFVNCEYPVDIGDGWLRRRRLLRVHVR